MKGRYIQINKHLEEEKQRQPRNRVNNAENTATSRNEAEMTR